MGHQTGDLLLQGAAQCMRQCFGSYGQIYRFGGDEFAAIITAQDVELMPLERYLQQLCKVWSGENDINMSISIGFCRKADYPEAGVHSLESIADQKMYADKARFYSSQHNDRRGVTDECK